jgi:hypothetical protein
MKLEGSRFGSRVLEIGKHSPLVGGGAPWLRSMFGDNVIRARFFKGWILEASAALSAWTISFVDLMFVR